MSEIQPFIEEPEVVFPNSTIFDLYKKVPIYITDGMIKINNNIILSDINIQIPLGKVIGIVGKNGSGKTSLLNYIMDRSSEEVIISSKVVFSSYMQFDYDFDSEKSLLQYCQMESEYSLDSIAIILKNLGFTETHLITPVNKLSGGESTKLALALTFIRKSNFIILDEPTNFLDVFAIKGLEKIISSYPGTVLVSSHDRIFMDNIADIIYSLEQGKIFQIK
ncbi:MULTISPECIES: ATP-binding cassette domain-containing protein [unclassified Granulicatella]|uniref:ATP-binding cassette domain-containing protein n=1 Tax=unclassified Granulicatella TaxID=2630493 RepID=UPI001073F498|nr:MULTISPECIES: ATP-binding cassette domain-containing protein [unclassified Granulicatella]MBF0780637.1 ABC-F family ATP-binding cassette domain-containing protein [Granulicatella sp. 19428wC4_WM01]TFU94566.1 ABC-F family ATP-binding cassette domain-containing protein [Granulicatella sp. WM01]